jgi:Glycosyltransferase family 87
MNSLPKSPATDSKLKDLSVLCWALCLVLVIVPECLAIKGHVESGRFQRIPQIDFVFFYGMGKMFNEYPAAKVYDYELQKKVCTDLHPLKDLVYGPNPYSPAIGILFRPFARMTFSAALLLWMTVIFTLYAGGLYLFTGHFFPHDPVRRSLILCFALAFWPFMHFLTSGHIAMVGFFAMALAFREQEKKRPFLSGLALSICLYKPTLLLLLVPMLLITKRYKTLAGFLAGGIGQVIAITAIEGPAIWPGYFHLLLYFGSAAATRTQHAFLINSTAYVDLVSFFSMLPGGLSWWGRAILVGCAGYAIWQLLRAWLGSVGSEKTTQTLIWSLTLTATMVLNTYVGIWDCTSIVLSIVATGAVLRTSPQRPYYGWFTLLWVSILALSYVTEAVAEATGFQILTVLFVALGVLQLAVVRKLEVTAKDNLVLGVQPVPAAAVL